MTRVTRAWFPVVSIVVALALLLPARGNAQAPIADGLNAFSIVGLGYVGNLPQLFRGGGLVFLSPTRVGFFVDAKVSSSTPADRSDFEPDITRDEALNVHGDWAFSSRSVWLTVNGGLTRVLTSELAVYAGAGYARRDAFEEFYTTEVEERGEAGFYWISDPEYSGTFVNLLGGVYLRAGRSLILRFGAESLPPGLTVGAHLYLPLR